MSVAQSSDVYPATKLWTTQQYHTAGAAGVFEGQRVELIDGKIYVMSPMNYLHAAGIRRVQYVLSQLAGTKYHINVQLPIALADGSEPEPDVAVVAGTIDQFDDHSPDFAELIVEVSVSSVEFDRNEKKQIYAAREIPEYWILNLRDRQLEVMRGPRGRAYESTVIFSGGQSIAPVVFPDHEIAVDDLLPRKPRKSDEIR